MRKLLVLFAAFALVVAFTAPAMAETSFYGSARMTTGMTSWADDAADTDDSDLDWALDNGSSRFGANFKNEDVGANVELRPNDGGYYRHFYGWWQAGFGKLIVGQTWTPTFVAIDDAVYMGGYTSNYGSMIGSLRQPQIALHTGGLKVALRTPSSSAVIGSPKTSGDIDIGLPAIEASYNLKAGPAGITLFLGYNAYDDIDAATEDAYNVASHLVGGNVALSFGAASVKVTGWTAQNMKEGGFNGGALDAVYDPADDEIKDTTSTGMGVALGYGISDTMRVNAGYFTSSHEVTDGVDTDNSMIYVNLPITLAKGVTITPEVDLRTDGEDESTTNVGAYWQINF